MLCFAAHCRLVSDDCHGTFGPNGPKKIGVFANRSLSRFFPSALLVAALFATNATPSAAQPPSKPPSTAVVSELSLSGAPFSGGTVYFNIPYAQPPVGDLRWRAPVAATPWQGVRDAARRGPACMQPDQHWNAVDAARSSEDCLYLNIWRPTGTKKYPVMVWFHGGAFTGGAGNTPLYDGEALTRRGVIVVTVNYRLGILGYLAHPDLSNESPGHVSGNYGLQDQVEALRWVKRNIVAFGGDSANITLFGQSAGALSIGYLLAAPAAKGLFDRAILQSGTPYGNLAGMFPSLASAEAQGKSFGSIADLRRLSASDILALSMRAEARRGEGLRFAPIVDGMVLPKAPSEIFAGGGLSEITIIAGTATREIASTRSPEQLSDALRAAFGDRAATAMALYTERADKVHFGSTGDQFNTDLLFGCGTVRLARSAQRAWVYEFSQPSPGEAEVRHSADLSYVFGNANRDGGVLTTRPFNKAERALSDRMMTYWTNFAKTGDPNGKGSGKWPIYTSRHPGSLWLSGDGDHVRASAKPQCETVFAG